ncbi:murein transglycosylase A [Photobacterium sanctipauli]|uniref:Membrane-bound lytic murein transglycosylase A n=1 Tax=Photobacterium sanctipauli TaxID=1342794 RepID=A0A2T3NDV0_9GAMM|nr:murein transglycosylase A [Photobacterium sanctipauli]PSW12589.1 murein transglycosylase A [Photobacterium sanctipauli]
MFRKATIALLILGLAGCAKPTDRGQQYLDNRFDQVLNQVPAVNSDKPQDYSQFSQQMEKVLERSPSMAATNQALYRQIENWAEQSGDPAQLGNYGIQVAQMGGGDGHGNVMFTGYFSPVIELRHQPDETYRYPVYGMPECEERCPTRAEIYNGALAGQGLELGYSDSMLDIFMMEVQGSGFVHFEDNGELEYFAYNGKNGHPYVSIGRVLIERGEVPREKMSLKAIADWVYQQDEATVRELLEQNPSYVFFKPKDNLDVMGTAGIPLQAHASVAADREYLPMGSVILAEVPQLDEDGNWNGQHVLKLLMALDTGGAVKKNHLDLYHGMGAQAGIDAGHYKHFGRVWKLGLQGSKTEQPWVEPVKD